MFQSFWAWLAARLGSYIGTYASASAAAIEPVAVTLGVLYVMVWGYLHMKGAIQEPFLSGAMRVLTLALVLGVGLPIVFQALINMAVAVELFPVTGQTLPLISSGGTSSWMICLAIGIILSASIKEADKEGQHSKIDESNPLEVLSGQL